MVLHSTLTSSLFRAHFSALRSSRNFTSNKHHKHTLEVVLILGSTRTEGPPHPANLGKRVSAFLQREVKAHGHNVTVIDPMLEDLPLLQKPQFAYRQGEAPPPLDTLAAKLKAADAYIMCTPEYNHAPSPALLNILNHFGSSLFSFKPSAIVSYSAGQWGGTRAAHSLRPVLSELGCLPVSAMINIPRAHEVFLDESGVPSASPERWTKYAGRTLSQLEWWGTACLNHKSLVDPWTESPAFKSDPSQRNAPK
jgi:chromate reductase, NAD(P)H dehydrogenase (quinone)